MMKETWNAKITNVSLNMKNHAYLTLDLVLEGNGKGVVFGGRCLGHGYLGADEFEGYARGLEYIMRIMDVVGVEALEDLTGKYVRVVNCGWGESVTEIGNIIKDKWFNIEEFFGDRNED